MQLLKWIWMHVSIPNDKWECKITLSFLPLSLPYSKTISSEFRKRLLNEHLNTVCTNFVQTTFNEYTTQYNAMHNMHKTILNRWNWNNNGEDNFCQCIGIRYMYVLFHLLEQKVYLTWVKRFLLLTWKLCHFKQTPFNFCCNPTSKLKCNLITTIPNWWINFRYVLCIDEKDKYNSEKLLRKLYRKIWIWNLK